MAGDRERALAAGCDDYDTKPVDLASLIAKIDALLARESQAVSQPARILVVDDNEDNRYTLTRRLHARGLRERGDRDQRPRGTGADREPAIRPGAARHHDAAR